MKRGYSVLRYIFIIGTFIGFLLSLISPILFKIEWLGTWNEIQSLKLSKENSQKRKKSFFNYIGFQENNKRAIFGFQKPFVSLKEDEKAEIPLFGTGYFLYYKVGKDIRYYNNEGEELWRKKFAYYPRSDYFGELLLLLASDSSHVRVMDYNGLSDPSLVFSGAYLSDFSFATKASKAFLVFSSGETYFFQSNNKKFLSYTFSWDNKNIFLKSCTISHDAKKLAVHLLEGEEDKIVLFSVTEEKLEKEREIALEKTYPHRLNMAISSLGLLIASPNTNYFFGFSSSLDWKREVACSKECHHYRPVYADKNIFAYGYDNGKKWALLDKQGKLIFKASWQNSTEKPWRFLPTNKENLLGFQKGAFVSYFQYRIVK